MTEIDGSLDVSSENSTNVRPRDRGDVIPPALKAARTALQVAAAASPDVAARLAERFFTTARRAPRPARELEALSRARHFLIPSEGSPLAAWEWGEAGPRVLLVHGWEGRGAQLAPVAERLAALGFRAVAFDAPAHGDTPGTTCTFFDVARAIEHAARALGPLHAIVAHSMGGAALTWAVRSHGLAKRYVVIAPPADLRDFSRGFARMMGLSDELRVRMERRIEERYDVSLDDVVTEKTAAKQYAPLLVVHDVGDQEVPFDKGRRLADAWPGATLMRTEGLGHRRILREREVVRAVERFVAWGLAPS
ncbi:alpha/beta hydrolase [Sandaracinus amylolyticus]|uniref:Hydrolase, putative n=1 Tax=Sandaracinus amylolyticus TaxID=927083 RepID=A0A0F6VYK4_9BACT|nr:alpha/beta hydrolase [Sandaracinus amylolyticus]AKF02912.1 hydrolase, putative [Sandaracinus amylolyticus]